MQSQVEMVTLSQIIEFVTNECRALHNTATDLSFYEHHLEI